MAIDSVRLLTDSAAQIYRRLNHIRPLVDLDGPFDDWRAELGVLDYTDEQQLRRDYRHLVTMLAEIETLVRSRQDALALVRAQAKH